jgi:hypothetical protein
VEVEVKAGGLPADYDGWLQYTAVNASKLGLQGGFDSFTNTMSVPDVPKKRAQVLYFFPGLQNIDWCEERAKGRGGEDGGGEDGRATAWARGLEDR